MSSRKNVEAFRGILIPSSRIQHTTISTALSSFNQDGAQGGVPTSVVRYGAMELESRAASGTSSADAVEVYTYKAGSPGEYAAGEIQPGGFLWRPNGTVDWYGAPSFTTITGWDNLESWVGVPTYITTRSDAITTPAGTIIVAARRSPGSAASISLARIPLTGSQTTQEVASTGTVAAPNLMPALFLMPDNKIGLLVFNDYTESGSTRHNLSLYVSINDGTTWTLNAERVLAEDLASTVVGIPITYRRIRAAYNAGQVLLVIAKRLGGGTAPRDHLMQYASNDAGASFAYVSTAFSGAQAGGVHDVVPFGTSGFLMAYCGSDFATWGADSQALAMPLGSAFTAISAAPVYNLKNGSPGTLNANGELGNTTQLALVVDEAGVAWCITNTADGVMLESSQDGETWTRATTDGASLTASSFLVGNSNGLPQEYSAAVVNSSLRLFGTKIAGVRVNQLCQWQFGAYQTHTPPEDAAFSGQTIGSQVTWYPADLPNTAGWTVATVGAATATLSTTGSLNITAAALESLQYTYTLTPAVALDYTVCVLVDAQQVSGLGGNVGVIVADAGNEYRMTARAISTTQIEIVDAVAGTVYTTITVPAAGFQLRIYVTQTTTGARLTVWQSDTRRASANTRAWFRILGANNQALTPIAPPVGARQLVTFGQNGAGVSSWELVAAYVSGALSKAHAVQYPRDLKTQNYSVRYRRLNNYISVRAIGGPSLVGDLWRVEASYRYGIENVDPRRSPSPDRIWRTDAGPNVIAWEFTSAAQLERMLSPLMGLYISNASFSQATLEKRTGAATWTTIGTWDSTSGQSGLTWSLQGDTVVPRTGSSAADYWYPFNALEGDMMILDGFGTTITASSEGAWANPVAATTTRLVRLEVEPDSGAANNGTAGAIASRSACLVFNADPQANAYRLTIPTQVVRDPINQTYDAGVIMLGPIVAFGHRYSWGRQVRSSPNTTLTTARDGTRTARNEGRTRRTVEFGWTDGVDQSQLERDQSASSLPDYITNTNTAGGTPLAAAVDGPAMMRGIVEMTRGPELPVVYLPWIEPQAAGTNYMVVHRDHMLYGRIVSDVSIETVQGDEYAGEDRRGEVVRTSSILIEEEL